MVLTKTPICEFGKKPEFFELKSTEGNLINLNDVKGKKGIFDNVYMHSLSLCRSYN